MDDLLKIKRETTGVTGALAYDPLQYCILAAGTAIAWLYTIELDIVVLYTFRRRTGLYFWSLLISSWGASLHALGFILKFLVGTSWEFIISGLYIFSTVRLLGAIYHSMTRKVMFQLIFINSVCIGMDIILIVLEFTNNYVGEASIKPMLYAIKLKLEFAVLNQLMGLTKAGLTEGNRWRSGGDPNSHELKNRTLASTHDPEAGAPPKKAAAWIPARGMRGSVSGARHSLGDPEHIVKTEHIDVITEPALSDQSNTSSSTAVTTGEQSPAAKSKSLMGTATVFMPGRATRNSRPEAGNRNSSPSESEKEFIRKSLDSEKEGTRWIEGHYDGSN
ncbi:MAG: hypothetical protein Q9195_003750 [Heterodermia aff. obscurata]